MARDHRRLGGQRARYVRRQRPPRGRRQEQQTGSGHRIVCRMERVGQRVRHLSPTGSVRPRGPACVLLSKTHGALVSLRRHARDPSTRPADDRLGAVHHRLPGRRGDHLPNHGVASGGGMCLLRPQSEKKVWLHASVRLLRHVCGLLRKRSGRGRVGRPALRDPPNGLRKAQVESQQETARGYQDSLV